MAEQLQAGSNFHPHPTGAGTEAADGTFAAQHAPQGPSARPEAVGQAGSAGPRGGNRPDPCTDTGCCPKLIQPPEMEMPLPQACRGSPSTEGLPETHDTAQGSV